MSDSDPEEEVVEKLNFKRKRVFFGVIDADEAVTDESEKVYFISIFYD